MQLVVNRLRSGLETILGLCLKHKPKDFAAAKREISLIALVAEEAIEEAKRLEAEARAA